jgi:hypothetical protein
MVMAEKKTNGLFWLMGVFFACLQCTILLTQNFQEAEAGTETMEWDVSAFCAPQVDINSSTDLTISVLPKIQISGTEISAYLSLPNFPVQNSISHVWNFPTDAWHAVLFKGPPVVGTFYCQDQFTNSKPLYMGYMPDQNTKIFMSSQEMMGRTEIDTIGENNKKSYHKVMSDSEQMEKFSAGMETANPYWLTFAFPVHSPHSLKTTLQFQFE